MHYWVSFAHGLQSRVLIPIARILNKHVLFIVRSPFKALKFFLKLYFTFMLLLFCIITLFASFGAKATTVYDRASNSVPAGVTRTCLKDGRDPQAVLEEVFQQSLDQTKANVSPNHLAKPTEVSPNGRVDYADTCTVYKTIEYEIHNSDGERQGSTKIRKSITGIFQQAPSCNNLGNNSDGSQAYPDHTIMGTTGSETRCYTSYDLTDASSCSSQNNDVLASSDSPPNVCRELADGSKCAMEKYAVGGSYAYTQMVEPSTCFSGPLSINAYEETSDVPPTDPDNCYELGNGVSACPSDPNQSCPNGQCRTGCGTFDIGGGAQFVCLTGGDQPIEPIDAIQPVEPIDISSPEFDTTRGTNTLLAQQGANISTLNLIAQSQREQQIKTNRSLSDIDGEMKKQTGLLQGIKDSLEQDDNPTTPANFGDGQLYDPNDYEVKNYGTVLLSAVDEMKASPIFQAVDRFFDISLSGSCPTYSTDVPYLNTIITIDQFCSPTMQSVWPIVKAIILLVFSFLAFRVAVL